MPKAYTHTAAFAHFGTKPRNVQWSWSARDEGTRTVVVTLWQDQFTYIDGTATYARPAFTAEAVDTRLGFRELMNNLAWAQKNSGGCFKVIIAMARDKAAEPRSIARCFPSAMIMRLVELDTGTGAFRAEQVKP